MQRRERLITSFRRRLIRLINEKCDGRYTYLAQRAGIPISTLEHTIHEARRLPGGDHLIRMGRALDVTVQYLLTGDDRVWPVDRPARAAQGGRPRGGSRAHGGLTIPVVACGCPAACPLAQPARTRSETPSTMVVEHDVVIPHAQAALIAVTVTGGCPASGWQPRTRLVVARGVRPPRWEALTLIHAAGHCQWGHLSEVNESLVFAEELEGEVRIIPAGTWRILGVAVAVVAPL